MSHLHTNVIALPASTKLIQWRRYECNYNNSDASGAPLFLSVCRKLLQVKVPCLWRPLDSSDTASQIISLLHTPVHEGLFGEPQHSITFDGTKTSEIQVPDRWEVWVFHAIIPMEQALDLAPIPSDFKVISSGEISWKHGSKNIEVEGDASQQSVDDINGLFNRSLDNLIDCALLPLSIVRFGLRQWLSLTDLSADQEDQSQPTESATNTPYSRQVPLCPHSPELDLQLGIAEFVSSSALFDDGKFLAPASSSACNAPNTLAEKQQRPWEHKSKACGSLHMLKLSATLAPLQNTLLLQYNSVKVHGIRPMSHLDSNLERRRSNGAESLAADYISSSDKPPGDSAARLVPIAAVRIAPLGIPATLVAIPTGRLGDTEDRTIDAWSAALGYPTDFLTGKEEGGTKNESRLVWIKLSKTSDPMLYPRKLVLIDEAMSVLLESKSADHSISEASAITTAEEKEATDDRADNVVEQSPARMDVDQPTGSVEIPNDELEEGESVGGEYDEEGEIAEYVASAEMPALSSTEGPQAIPELDTVVSELQPIAPPTPLEESLVEIQKSMVKFQSELRVKEEEEEKVRKKEMAQKNIAAAKGPSGLTKSTSARSSSGASGTKKRQRSNTKDEQSIKARRKSGASSTVPPPKSTISDSSNEDIPLQALVATTTTTSALSTVGGGSAVQPLTQQPSAANADENAISTDAANGDIGSLFGDAGMGGEGNGGLGDAVANMGDDMGLGMGLGMDMGMGDNLGDFASGMFGVTDDDFNFFDSVPAQQPKPAEAMTLFSQPAIDTTSTMDIDTKPQTTAFDADLPSGDPSASAKAHPPADGNTTGVLEQNQEMDDLFDDGVFDSFFGGQTTAASAATETPAAVSLVKQEDMATADMFAAQAASDNTVLTGIAAKPEPTDAVAADVSSSDKPSTKASLAAQSLSSPPGTTAMVSLSDTHSGPGGTDLAANPAHLSATATATATAAGTAMAADMATPASLKMTPAPSIDIQTPTPTMQSLHTSKGGDSADEHSSVLLATADNSPATLTGTLPTTHGGIARSSIPEDSEVVYAASGPSAHPLGQSQMVPGSNSKGKEVGSWKYPFVSSTALIPEHYRFVSTPYDDIGKNGRSWLRDAPTPASLGDTGNSQDMMDPSEIQHPAYIEKSLNPVAWLKRVSARHIQKYQMEAVARSRRASTLAAAATQRPGRGPLPNIRKLRGWLASYKAKTMYTRHVIPRHVLAYQQMADEETAESSMNAASAIQPPSGAHAKTETMAPDATDGGNDRSASARLALSLDASEAARPEAVSNLQYPVVHGGTSTVRDSDGHSETAKLLKSSGTQQQQHQQPHQQMAAGLPTFTSIINPRKLWKNLAAQMPGSLMPSLSMCDLQKASAGVGSSASAAVATASLSKQAAVQTNAVEPSWVPTWMLLSKGLADALVGSQEAHWLGWASGLQVLACAARESLMAACGGDLVHLASIPEARVLLDACLSSSGMASSAAAAAAVDDASVGNLGARIGGLLMLGPEHRNKTPSVMAESGNMGGPVGVDDYRRFGESSTDREHADGTARRAYTALLNRLRQDSNWTETVTMLADWAVGSSLLPCTQPSGLEAQPDEAKYGQHTAKDQSMIGAAVSTALLSFWSHQNTADAQNPGDAAARGLLTLSSLLALENTSPSSSSKYSGYVVKKRRVLPQPSGIYSSAARSSSSSSSRQTGSSTAPLVLSSAGTTTANGSAANNTAPAYAGSMVVPSGPGVVEPLPDVRILVGSYGQEDVTVPPLGAITLKSRDAESIYIKRWRYAQKLASRATHDARVATGEIEETEEGEEREDGEDEVDDTATTAQVEPVEDWPDPDGYMMESEDALRRVCVSTSPVSLRWWAQMQMRPVGAAKDVRWVAFVPPLLDPSQTARAAASSRSRQGLPAEGGANADGQPGEEEAQEEAAPVHVREWCQRSADVAQWYLGDVDSAYQAQHLGVHRPLGLQRALDGTFTQLTESVLPMGGSSSTRLRGWSARLRYEAERLGHCTAHGWYTTSQVEQQKQDTADASLSAAAGPLSGTTLVLYMLVPHSRHMAPWLAVSEAATVALRTFEKTLGSLITRTSHGVPSSISTVSSQVPWPAVVVHPLPLDLLAQWRCGGRPAAAPTSQGTAMAVYNRCPEPLSSVPPALLLAHPTAAAAGAGATSTMQRKNRTHGSSAGRGEHDASEFIAAVAAPGTTALAKKDAEASHQQRQLVWHSGYFVRTPSDHRTTSTASVSNSQGTNNRPSTTGGGASLGMAAFAHRAYIVSMPAAFPASYNPERCKDSAFVPATISMSRITRQNIVLDDPMAHLSATAPATASPLQRPYPTTLSHTTRPVPATDDDTHLGPHSPTTSFKLGDEVSCELDEVYVSFGCATPRNGGDSLSLKRKGSATPSSSTALCSRLTTHPLRPNDQLSTLHCIYTVISGPTHCWIAVCWCDERGEYVEHDVFSDPPGYSTTMSPAAAARIWTGCLRYQRLFCKHQPLMRVVLGQWQGMGQAQAMAWQEYAAAWNANHHDPTVTAGILLHVVSIGINPVQGLRLHSNNSVARPPPPPPPPPQGTAESLTTSQQFSVILHGQHPRFDYTCDAMLGETLASPNDAKEGGAWLWTTGYLALLHGHGPCTVQQLPCLCVQLLPDTPLFMHQPGPKYDTDARKLSLLTTRSILRQYHQLAVLRHAEDRGSAAMRFGSWPESLLPLPVAIISDIQNALASLL